MKQYFTYGSNHVDEQGNSLGNCYTPIDGDWDEARAKMMEARGPEFSMQYDTPEQAGVHEFELAERSLESVTFNKERMHRDFVRGLLAQSRKELQERLASIDRMEGILLKLPREICHKMSVLAQQIDLDNLTRDEVETVLARLNAGKWTKTINGGYQDKIDYHGTVDGVPIRLWAAAPPGTCRVVEYEEEIPAQKVIKRKLVCSQTP